MLIMLSCYNCHIVVNFKLILSGLTAAAASEYYGAKIGALSQLHHGVSGDVYAIDSRTIFLKDFNYDGEGPGKQYPFFYKTISPIPR